MNTKKIQNKANSANSVAASDVKNNSETYYKNDVTELLESFLTNSTRFNLEKRKIQQQDIKHKPPY